MSSTRPFLVVIHDATPAHARETDAMLRDLAPRVGSRLALGVVPNWLGQWPLAAHPAFCRLLREGAEEVLLHGYFHRRRRGSGPVSWLAEGCDEMNGLDREETKRLLGHGQELLAEAFGEPARGFLAPGWQRGHVRHETATDLGLDHVLGFFSLESCTGPRIPLATWTWDCGRWRWLGHLGHGIGRVLHSLGARVPVLAIHPRDLERGYWPRILRLTDELLDSGYEPSTVAGLLQATSSAASVSVPTMRGATEC